MAEPLVSVCAVTHSRNTERSDGPSSRTAGKRSTMNQAQHNEPAITDVQTEPAWVDDFADLTVDDLRELPNHLQLGMDLSVFD